MKLLIIEDQKEISDAIVEYLSREDYLCEQACSFNEALERIWAYEYDCVLLDLMLPGGSGLDLLKDIKETAPSTGIIIVSAKDSLEDKVSGLRLGADDYLQKPFHLPELSMRIYAIIRRRKFQNTNILNCGPIALDLLGKSVMINGIPVQFTKTEYEIFLFLIENRGRVVSKNSLAEHISGDIADIMDDFNFVYAHIKNIKAKLSSFGITDCIKTCYGIGYKWNIEL